MLKPTGIYTINKNEIIENMCGLTLFVQKSRTTCFSFRFDSGGRCGVSFSVFIVYPRRRFLYCCCFCLASGVVQRVGQPKYQLNATAFLTRFTIEVAHFRYFVSGRRGSLIPCRRNAKIDSEKRRFVDLGHGIIRRDAF